MSQLNLDTREITLKIVYYGPALSGKTTNLRMIHKKLMEHARGEMVTLDTQDDRTLYFDFLPVELGGDGDYKIKLKMFPVPGQVLHRSTRRVVLAGVDAVAFIADSQRSSAAANAYSYRDLESNLRANGLDVNTIPLVVQFNKRDLDDIKTLDEVRQAWDGTGIPTVPAVAAKGEGVIETCEALLVRLYRHLDKIHSFGKKFGISEAEFLHGVLKHFEEPKQETNS